MKFRHLICAALFFLAPIASFAFTPEAGFYQQHTVDATGGGTGITIEIQNEYMFAAGYVYNPDGSPTFVTMQGQLLQQSDGSWKLSSVGDPNNYLATYSGGQCIGKTANCPYKKPTASVAGDFTIQFVGENLAAVTWGGGGNQITSLLTRFNFNSGGPEPISLAGEWDVLVDASTSNRYLYSGEKILINKVVSLLGSATNRLLTGCVPLFEGSPSCSSLTIGATGTLCTSCSPVVYNYSFAIQDTDLGTSKNIIRVYHFSSVGGVNNAFTQTFKGTVDFCPDGVTSTTLCTATVGTKFVAYRSASAQYAVNGKGMD